MRKPKLLGVCCIFFAFTAPYEALRAQGLERGVALLDLTRRNRFTSNSKLFSAIHALRVAGVPFIVTEDLQEAMKHFMVITSARIVRWSFKKSEKTLLRDYVWNGGILVAPRVSDPFLYPVFGISGRTENCRRHLMEWNVASGEESLHRIDEPEEVVISLGRLTYTRVIKTAGYQLSGAFLLAVFDDGSTAVTKHNYGRGYAYAIGFSLKDVILRSQLNRDYEAQRAYTNGFEPTSDTVMLFLRGLYEEHLPFAAWKHTSPGASKASFIITHDTCSRTSMEMMNQFADLEVRKGVVATYNIHTYYLRSVHLGPEYYTPHIRDIIALKSKGMNLASHSVGHLPDFDELPIGKPGNTMENYRPYYDGTRTTGGSLYAELEVSKLLLKSDIGVTANIFRSGYLLWHRNQIDVMDALGYKYHTSRAAGAVLTNFPYQCVYNTSFTGRPSDIYEIPMALSDVLDELTFSQDSVDDIVSLRLEVMEKNANNNAPTVILIHPNSIYKLKAEELLLRRLPKGVEVVDMESFGEFWRARDSFTFRTQLLGNRVLIITIPTGAFAHSCLQSLIVKDGRSLARIIVRTENGAPVNFIRLKWNQSNLILRFFSARAIRWIGSICPGFDLIPHRWWERHLLDPR